MKGWVDLGNSMKEYTACTELDGIAAARERSCFSLVRISAMSTDNATFPTLEGFDPFGADFLCDPAPTIKRAQATKPVFYYPPLRMWVITSYDDICRAARDWETFSSKAAGMVPRRKISSPRFLTRSLLITLSRSTRLSIRPTGPQCRATFFRGNSRSRNLIFGASPNLLIDRLHRQGSCDFMQEFCYPLSLA